MLSRMWLRNCANHCEDFFLSPIKSSIFAPRSLGMVGCWGWFGDVVLPVCGGGSPPPPPPVRLGRVTVVNPSSSCCCGVRGRGDCAGGSGVLRPLPGRLLFAGAAAPLSFAANRARQPPPPAPPPSAGLLGAVDDGEPSAARKPGGRYPPVLRGGSAGDAGGARDRHPPGALSPLSCVETGRAEPNGLGRGALARSRSCCR